MPNPAPDAPSPHDEFVDSPVDMGTQRGTRYSSRAVGLLARQIEAGGGRVERDLLVIRPGIQLISESHLIPETRSLFSALNVDSSQSDAMQLAEAFARVTYLAFSRSPSDSRPYLDRVIRTAGHRSVTKGTSYTVLISGISLAAASDLVSSGADIARLTSSNTRSMNWTLYRVPDLSAKGRALFERAATDFAALRDSVRQVYDPARNSPFGIERFNMGNLVSKSTALFFTMNLKDSHQLFHRVLASRYINPETQALCESLCNMLHARHPQLIEPVDYYRSKKEPLRSEYNVVPLGDLVARAGGRVEGGLVYKPGIQLVRPSQQVLNAYAADPDMRADEVTPTFHLHGIAYETALELSAHQEGTVIHLNVGGGNTGFSDELLLRVQSGDTLEDWENELLTRYHSLRSGIEAEAALSLDHSETAILLDALNLGSRAVSISFTMNLVDFHKMCIGRLSHQGNELEVQEVCRDMCSVLRTHFPQFVLDPDEYYRIGNEQKYRQ